MADKFISEISKGIRNTDYKQLGEDVLVNTADTSILALQLGFTLSTAMAFNDFVKKVLESSLNKEGYVGYLKYAVVMALATGVVFTLTNKSDKYRLSPRELINSDKDSDE